MSMATLQITDIRDVRPRPSDLESALPDIVRVKNSANVHAGRADSAPITFENLQPDDVVEIELEDELRILSRNEDLEQDYGAQRSRAADVIELSPTLQIGGPTRGWPTGRSRRSR
jgi:hypothetical protein